MHHIETLPPVKKLSGLVQQAGALRLFEAVNRHNLHSECFVRDHRVIHEGSPCACRDEPEWGLHADYSYLSPLHAQR